MSAYLDFFIANWDAILGETVRHVELTLLAVAVAALWSIPTAIAASRMPRFAMVLGAVANLAQTIPSFAVLGLVIPLLGIGFIPALFALFLRAILPIYLNTYLGIRSVEPRYIEAARGVGLRDREILLMIELPLAVPIILAGLRTAAVESVAIATLAAFIGAGGLGDFILQGIALLDPTRLLAGALPAAALAIVIELTLHRIEKMVTPRLH
jgi:osmoprotectant transport system permease protein